MMYYRQTLLARSSPAGSVDCIPDLTYAEVGSSRLTLDLYLPSSREQVVPAALYLHGGGWFMGSRREFAERPALLAAQGFAVASADYRLSGEAIFPAPLEDARRAIAWMRAKGPEHGFATERIGAWGASAGGHLAALLALAPDGAEESAVQAAVSWFGTHDLTAAGADLRPAPGLAPPSFLADLELPPGVTLPLDPSPEARLLGVSELAEAEQLGREASPVCWAGQDAPPLLICHGDRDAVVAIDHSVRLHEAVVAAGGNSSMLVVAGANHEDERFQEPDVIGALAGFLRFHLDPTAKAGEGASKADD